jgi:predicted cation transporter
VRGKTDALHLLYRLAGGALGILELTLAIALLAEIPTIEQLVPDLLQGKSAAGGMFRPGHISAVKIAGVYRITVKLSERLNARMLFAPARSLVRLLALPCRRYLF